VATDSHLAVSWADAYNRIRPFQGLFFNQRDFIFGSPARVTFRMILITSTLIILALLTPPMCPHKYCISQITAARSFLVERLGRR
jgi:hypothetical protein